MTTMEHVGINKTRCKVAILVGDPCRVDIICNHFGRNKKLSSKRGFLISETIINDIKVLVISTGIGCPSLAIVVEELCMLGLKIFLRVGTCGAINDELSPGSIIISTGAVREEGTSRQYIDQTYPAIADFELVYIFSKTLCNYAGGYYCGITHTKDSFYSEKVELQISSVFHKEQWEKWKKAGVAATDMETSCLYIVSSLRKVKSCSILISVGEDKSDVRITKCLKFILDSLPDIIGDINKILPQNDIIENKYIKINSFLE